MLLKRLPLSAKLLLNAALVIAGFCALLGWLTMRMRVAVREQHLAGLEHLVEVAHSQLVEFDERVRRGDLTLADAQKRACERLRHLGYGEQGYFWINDLQPAMVMHPKQPGLEGQQLADYADPDGKHLFREAVAVCREHGEGVVAYRWPKPGGKEPVRKLSYVKQFAPWGWIIGTGVYVDTLDRALAGVTTVAFVAALLMAMLAAVSMALTVRSITRPLGSSVAFAQHLADGDLTRTLALQRQDEVGALAESLNRMSGSLQRLLTEVTDGAGALTQSSQDLLAIAGSMAAGSEDTSQRVEGVAAASEQMSGGLTAVAASMRQASGAVTSVAGATEQMTATISAIARRSARARTFAAEAVAEATAAADRVHELGDAAGAIDEITTVISEISAQTSLLALNASIEAAHAGEAGRGFAVVASEIKTLAQRTSNATGDIRARIESIQGATAAGMEDIRRISTTVEGISTTISSIADAIEQQSATSQAMAVDIAQAAAGLDHVNRALEGSSQAADQIAGDVIGVSAVTAEVLHESARVRESAEDLSRLATQLRGRLERFRLV